MRLASKPAAVCQINNKMFTVDFHASIEKQMEVSDIELAREMGVTQHEIQFLEGKLSR